LFTVDAPNDRLAANDAVYTEALHTNAGTLGFDQPITIASFYPNWGSTQPGLKFSLKLDFFYFSFIKGCGVDATGACAHERSNLFYSESINSNRFVARRCTGYTQIVNRNCPGTGTGTMGMDASKGINGVFFLETNSASPFARG
jgi:pancreatic triacylglycerol lipase